MLKAKNIRKSYPTSIGSLEVLKGLDLSITKGEMISVTGPSGCGKSTLLNILGTLDRADSGSLEIEDQLVAELDDEHLSRLRSESIGFVFQFHHLLPEFSVLENLIIPQRLLRRAEVDSRERALELLEKVGLSERADHRPGAISGGERQRVAVLRALVNRPSVVLADEPTGNLDVDAASKLMEMISSLAGDFGQAFLIVTHNPVVAAICLRNLKMEDGQLISSPEK
ncbi:MAG: lipoprotein-releasing system ATP-binding protein LolD [Candidatus Marinimicrobia bacterium]|nr:lipoprotein-releasing system ATP-binding protein LolD [Candidatus Neomarinimicrobiota bacterium]